MCGNRPGPASGNMAFVFAIEPVRDQVAAHDNESTSRQGVLSWPAARILTDGYDVSSPRMWHDFVSGSAKRAARSGDGADFKIARHSAGRGSRQSGNLARIPERLEMHIADQQRLHFARLSFTRRLLRASAPTHTVSMTAQTIAQRLRRRHSHTAPLDCFKKTPGSPRTVPRLMRARRGENVIHTMRRARS